MAKLQELENRISNVERALIQLLGSIPSQINSLAVSSELNSSSTKNFTTHEDTIEHEEALHTPTSHNSNGKDAAIANSTSDTANARSSGKTKGARVSKAQDSPSEEPSINPSKAGRLVCCPHCQSSNISKNGHDRYGQQMYRCKNCKKVTTLKHRNAG